MDTTEHEAHLLDTQTDSARNGLHGPEEACETSAREAVELAEPLDHADGTCK